MSWTDCVYVKQNVTEIFISKWNYAMHSYVDVHMHRCFALRTTHSFCYKRKRIIVKHDTIQIIWMKTKSYDTRYARTELIRLIENIPLLHPVGTDRPQLYNLRRNSSVACDFLSVLFYLWWTGLWFMYCGMSRNLSVVLFPKTCPCTLF